MIDLEKSTLMQEWMLGEISKSVNEVKKLENALMGVQSQVENMSQSFSDLSAQLEATINEISKGPTATQKFAKGFKGGTC